MKTKHNKTPTSLCRSYFLPRNSSFVFTNTSCLCLLLNINGIFEFCIKTNEFTSRIANRQNMKGNKEG